METDFLDLSEVAKTLGLHHKIKISFDFLASFINTNPDKDRLIRRLSELIYLAVFKAEQGQTNFSCQILNSTNALFTHISVNLSLKEMEIFIY